ncbi:hypothetical protein EJ02DRAFT_22459 [Clathrospora elynae]|uniref:F-box domain-containing protein n=1 Tax=Clathrospora elynae TaxID=706981 RepID=A0A6A5SEH7_9PLEO|nr:hypothetical protein EJ02DRAFT_22459 [Clathrospora elynae]
MASFSHLPAELVEYIVNYLSQSDKYAFCRLNKALNQLAIPFLYRHVDLFIPPGNKLPRIDRFCLNIINDSRTAGRVESIRLGLCSGEGVKEGQRWLPRDRHFNDEEMFDKAMNGLNNRILFTAGIFLRNAIGMREYSSYAALILLFLPSLRRLELADYKSATFDHVHTVLSNLNKKNPWNRRHPSGAFIDALSHIKEVSLNIDRHSGVAYPRENSHYSLDHILHIMCIEKLEMSIPDGRNPIRRPLVSNFQQTNITTLIIRHSGSLSEILQLLLSCVPKLRSFTYEIHHDCGGKENTAPRLIDLPAWIDSLRQVRETLEILVFSAEYCDTSKYFFAQPRIGDKFHGYLDLTSFERLHTLEAPFPFLTGDVEFSITTEIYALLPPNLRHLSLRPDLSHAQLPFPFDVSILPSALTFEESKTEAQHMMNARMDVSYMFQASLTLLDYAPDLETISVWQPADASLEWFDGQVADFATTCKNKNVNGKIITPMLLRRKKVEHRDLIKEVTVFDRVNPVRGHVEKFFRQEWEGRPLGLASQYHLHALRSHMVQLHR